MVRLRGVLLRLSGVARLGYWYRDLYPHVVALLGGLHLSGRCDERTRLVKLSLL